jgi:3-hydroxyacyl-[acyl-carrier-protein] dehydratase
MPPTPLIDLASLDLTKVQFDRNAIAEVNPQAYEMSQLDAIIWHDLPKMLCLGYKDVTDNEFWIRGHIPGRPIMPGVIMVEACHHGRGRCAALQFLHEAYLRFRGVYRLFRHW